MKFPVTQDFIDTIAKKRSEPTYKAMQRIGDVQRLYRDTVRVSSKQCELPCSYRMLLFQLSRLEPGVTQLTLVKATHLKPPTVSVTLQKMEADGLVHRRSNEHDLRQTLVYLTDKGREIIDSINDSFESGNETAMRGFTEEEEKQLSAYLDRIIDNLIAVK